MYGYSLYTYLKFKTIQGIPLVFGLEMISQLAIFILMLLIEQPPCNWFQFDLSDHVANKISEVQHLGFDTCISI